MLNYKESDWLSGWWCISGDVGDGSVASAHPPLPLTPYQLCVQLTLIMRLSSQPALLTRKNPLEGKRGLVRVLVMPSRTEGANGRTLAPKHSMWFVAVLIICRVSPLPICWMCSAIPPTGAVIGWTERRPELALGQVVKNPDFLH